MMSSIRTERMNVWVSPSCREWIKQEAERLDIPQGAVIELAIEQLRSQRDVLQLIPRLVEVAEKLDRIEVEVKKQQASVFKSAAGDRVKACRSEAEAAGGEP